jgi:hypothetical protein
MKYLLAIVTLVIVFVVMFSPVSAANVGILACTTLSDSGFTLVHLGYASDTEAEVMTDAVLGSNSFFGSMPEHVQIGHFPALWGVVLVTEEPVTVEMYNETFYTSIEVNGSESACTDADLNPGTGQPDGGLFQIVKTVDAPGTYQWEIWSGGAWDAVVTTEAEQKEDGWQVTLVLGPDNTNHDAGDYRVTLISNPPE